MFLNAVPREALPLELQESYDGLLENTGDPRFFQAGGNAPELLEWYFGSFYGDVFYKGRVDVRTKELLRLKLSTIHGCAICNRNNRVGAREAGITDEQIDAIVDFEHGPFIERDRAVLRLAEQISLPTTDGYLSEELHAKLREFFDDGEIFELGMTAAVLTGMEKFMFVFDLTEREPNCAVSLPAGASS